MQEKQDLRARLKEKRAAIPPEAKKEYDRAIVERIAASKLFSESSAVLLYAPIGSEIDLLPLARIARRMGKPIAFPRCDVATNTMKFYLLEPSARLEIGAYRIPEPPADAPLCEPDEKSLCILPALTFDPTGARLGYGKGYYDRFLRDFPGICIGAVYETMMVRSVPTEPHDLPVSMIFTERGVCKAVPRQEASAPATDTDFKSTWRQKIDQIRRRVAKKEAPTTAVEAINDTPPEPPKVSRITVRALHAPPILVATTFVLLLLSRLIDTHLTNRNNEYAVVILLQLLIFLVPAIVYGKLRGEAFSERIRLRAPRIGHIWFIFCLLIVMITGGLLCSILTGGISSLTGNFTLYDAFVARLSGGFWETLYVVLAYALLPAICEELVFRSILCAEYERFGVGVAIAASALFFAMLHFSFPLFLTYLVLGAILACAMYATRSFFTALILHLCYNLFCLFGQPYLSAFYVRAGSNEIFIFCLGVLFLLFAAFAAGEARKIYHVYAKKNADSSYAPDTGLREIPKALLKSLLSPAVAVCIALWLSMAIAGLF